MLARIVRLIRHPWMVAERIRRVYYTRITLPGLVEKRREEWFGNSGQLLPDLRLQTLSYLYSNRLADVNVGAYSFVVGGPPLLYASCYAALTMHLYGALDFICDHERREWISYIKKHQRDDGLFFDPVINCEQAEKQDWWGWRHLTLHALVALTALGGLA